MQHMTPSTPVSPTWIGQRHLIGSAKTLLAGGRQSELNDALLVTPRHGVREEWNNAAISKHCRKTGHQLLISPILHEIHGRPPTVADKISIDEYYRKNKNRNTAELQQEVKLAVGMRVLVTRNIDLDADLANGARRSIVGIVLHPDKPAVDTRKSVTHLQYPPSIMLNWTRHGRRARRAWYLSNLFDGVSASVVKGPQIPQSRRPFTKFNYRSQQRTHVRITELKDKLWTQSLLISQLLRQEDLTCSIFMLPFLAVAEEKESGFCEILTKNGSRQTTTNICWPRMIDCENLTR